MKEPESEVRENAKRIAREYAERGDSTGWFDALYREAAGNNEHIPWADLEPNRYLQEFAETTGLAGNGRTALVVGCGLGDDARYLHELEFKVTAFDISPTAVEWARKLHSDTDIEFQVADLFAAPKEWEGAFEFVLEVYTIQPLPLELRERVIGAIGRFVAAGGSLLVVTRGRGDDEKPDEMPWPLSRKDLSAFETSGLKQVSFAEMEGDEETPAPRFIIEYERPAAA